MTGKSKLDDQFARIGKLIEERGSAGDSPSTAEPRSPTAATTNHHSPPPTCPRCKKPIPGETALEIAGKLEQHFNAAHPDQPKMTGLDAGAEIERQIFVAIHEQRDWRKRK